MKSNDAATLFTVVVVKHYKICIFDNDIRFAYETCVESRNVLKWLSEVLQGKKR